MHNYSDNFINQEVSDMAAAHGYTIEVTQDEFAENPREHCVTSTFVGGTRGTGSGVCDKQLPRSQHGNSIDEAVLNYANEQSLDINDMLWFTVYSFEHGNMALSLTPFNCRFDSGTGGFIYESKKAIREAFGVKRISTKLKEKIRSRMQSELEELSSWANGQVYSVAILDEDEDIITSCGSVFDRGNNIEDVARQLLLESIPA